MQGKENNRGQETMMSEIDHGDHTHPGIDTEELSYHARRVRAMETLLAEKGVLTIEEVQRNVDNVESRSPADGARVVEAP